MAPEPGSPRGRCLARGGIGAGCGKWEPRMKVNEIMTREVELVSPGDTVQTAARLMADIGAGALPVGENDRLVGMVSDRDIAIRAVAENRPADTCTVREVMSDGSIHYVFDDEEVRDASRKMGERQVRRLPVLNHDKRLVGIVSLGDIALESRDHQATAKASEGIARPTGKREQ
jgi:CBS domain-containing protein